MKYTNQTTTNLLNLRQSHRLDYLRLSTSDSNGIVRLIWRLMTLRFIHLFFWSSSFYIFGQPVSVFRPCLKQSTFLPCQIWCRMKLVLLLEKHQFELTVSHPWKTSLLMLPILQKKVFFNMGGMRGLIFLNFFTIYIEHSIQSII